MGKFGAAKTAQCSSICGVTIKYHNVIICAFLMRLHFKTGENLQRKVEIYTKLVLSIFTMIKKAPNFWARVFHHTTQKGKKNPFFLNLCSKYCRSKKVNFVKIMVPYMWILGKIRFSISVNFVKTRVPKM